MVSIKQGAIHWNGAFVADELSFSPKFNHRSNLILMKHFMNYCDS